MVRYFYRPVRWHPSQFGDRAQALPRRRLEPPASEPISSRFLIHTPSALGDIGPGSAHVEGCQAAGSRASGSRLRS